ncbi:hypothetical protein NMY22_g2260 [Coprinellus aureogranulatus]|nr:hypothetical protein NMY22_g2260 [Coprinellus aureogranulatus]
MMLAQYYKAILFDFEESYKRNIQDSQRKQNTANRQSNATQSMSAGGVNNGAMAVQRMALNQGANPTQPSNGAQRFPVNQPPPQRPQSAMMMAPGSDAIPAGVPIPEVNLLDQDVQGIKRKLDSNELDNKRVRPRTDGPDGSPVPLGVLDRHPSEPPIHTSQMTPTTPPNVVRPRQQPSRRKIEYIPLAREIDTYGGRDIKLIENEYSTANTRRIRDINEWGPIDIEHLTLSFRSRLATELSWGITALSLLSTMRAQTPGSGFPIMNCPDLMEEVLDLAEDLAFNGPEASPDDQLFSQPLDIYTHRQLTNIVLERQLQPFAALEKHQGSKDPAIGPLQRPANYILAVVNIIRNFTTVNDNIRWLSQHERAIDLLLRLCTVVNKDGIPAPASPALSLSDLIEIRKDTIYTLSVLAEHMPVSPTCPLSKDGLRMARRFIDVAASFLVDPVDAVSPLACVQRAGHPLNPHIRPPLFTDMALEMLVHFILPDANRQYVAKAIPASSLWTLLEALVHRMPVVDSDFQMMVQDVWLSHIHEISMAIYSIIFLAPPDLKQRIRTDRGLGFKNVMLRLLQRFLTTQDGRARFYLTARRIVETLKALDDSTDPFENPVDSSAPALSFGMGFADSTDSGQEKGTGLLGAHRDLGWEILHTREVQSDDLMFRELESLLMLHPMADHLPPPSYSQQDPVVAPRQSEETSDPQIVLLPTVDAVNFQKGYLGAEGERAAIEGEIQVKGIEPARWNRVSVSLRTFERAYLREIELGFTELDLYTRRGGHGSFPTSFPFSIPLMPDTPQSIQTTHSVLAHTLTALVYPVDHSCQPLRKSLTVYTRRYTSTSTVIATSPEVFSLDEPTRVEVQVPRTSFTSGEDVPLYVTIPPPTRELVVDRGFRLRNVQAELVRVIKVKRESDENNGDSDSDTESTPTRDGTYLDESQSSALEGSATRAHEASSSNKPPPSPLFLGSSYQQSLPVQELLAASTRRDQFDCGFCSTKHSPLPHRSLAQVFFPAKVAERTAMQRALLSPKPHCFTTSKRISHIVIPIVMLPPAARLPQVPSTIDEAYSKKHDRPPTQTNRYDEDPSIPHYSEAGPSVPHYSEAGPSMLPGAPPPFDDREAPPPFFATEHEASTSSRLPTFQESENEIILPDLDPRVNFPPMLQEIPGEGDVFGFPPSQQFDGHSEDMQRSDTPPPTLEMASHDTDLTSLADLHDTGHVSIETMNLVHVLEPHNDAVLDRLDTNEQPPPPPPAMDDPSDPPPSIDSAFRTPAAMGQQRSATPPLPPYLTPADEVRHHHEQEHVNRPPPYVD